MQARVIMMWRSTEWIIHVCLLARIYIMLWEVSGRRNDVKSCLQGSHVTVWHLLRQCFQKDSADDTERHIFWSFNNVVIRVKLLKSLSKQLLRANIYLYWCNPFIQELLKPLKYEMLCNFNQLLIVCICKLVCIGQLWMFKRWAPLSFSLKAHKHCQCKVVCTLLSWSVCHYDNIIKRDKVRLIRE